MIFRELIFEIGDTLPLLTDGDGLREDDVVLVRVARHLRCVGQRECGKLGFELADAAVACRLDVVLHLDVRVQKGAGERRRGGVGHACVRDRECARSCFEVEVVEAEVEGGLLIDLCNRSVLFGPVDVEHRLETWRGLGGEVVAIIACGTEVEEIIARSFCVLILLVRRQLATDVANDVAASLLDGERRLHLLQRLPSSWTESEDVGGWSLGRIGRPLRFTDRVRSDGFGSLLIALSLGFVAGRVRGCRAFGGTGNAAMRASPL